VMSKLSKASQARSISYMQKPEQADGKKNMKN